MELLLILVVAGLLVWAMQSAAASRHTPGDAGGGMADRDSASDGDGGN